MSLEAVKPDPALCELAASLGTGGAAKGSFNPPPGFNRIGRKG